MSRHTRNLRPNTRLTPGTNRWQLGEEFSRQNHARPNVPLRKTHVPPYHSRLFFSCALGLSLLAHVSLLWFQGPKSTLRAVTQEPLAIVQAEEIELISEAPEAAPSTDVVASPTEVAASPTEPEELRSLQAFHADALERAAELEQTLAHAAAQQEEAAAFQQQQLAALETAHSSLNSQVETLVVEKADLSAQLATERELRAELEQQLQEARQAKESEVAGIKGTYDRLVAALQGEISQKEIALHQARQRLVVSILDRVLFPSGQAALTPEGQRVLGKVGTILAKVPEQRILIEGHTDNVPISPALSARFPTNWELSTARATEVVKQLITQGQLPAQRLSAVGRADTVPVATNTTEEGRALNRRIEIILLPPENQPDNVS